MFIDVWKKGSCFIVAIPYSKADADICVYLYIYLFYKVYDINITALIFNDCHFFQYFIVSYYIINILDYYSFFKKRQNHSELYPFAVKTWK